MKRRVLYVAAAALIAGSTTTAVLAACGDKFLVPVRGTRFQRAPERRSPAAILFYQNPASGLPPLLASIDAETTLRKAGYRPTSVTTASELRNALAAGGWELVVAAAGDADDVQDWSGAGGPAVVPVLSSPTRAELTAVRARYERVLRAPLKSQAFLDVVDDAIDARVRAVQRPR